MLTVREEKKLSRVACVYLRHLPLQVVLRCYPEKRRDPLAIVDDPRPNASILTLNRAAYRLGVRPGMRLGLAQQLAPQLSVHQVAQETITHAVNGISELLQRFCPRVTPVHQLTSHHQPGSQDQLGAFFLDPSGLGLLYRGLRSWAYEIQSALHAEAYRSAVVVAFHHAAAAAIARTRLGVLVCTSFEQQQALLGNVPLSRLALSANLQAKLSELGVHVIEDLAPLSTASLQARLGDEAAKLYERYIELLPAVHYADTKGSGSRRHNSSCEGLAQAAFVQEDLDPPETQIDALHFRLRSMLETLVHNHLPLGHGIHRLLLTLRSEVPRKYELEVQVARPTRDISALLALLRLRLRQFQSTAWLNEQGVIGKDDVRIEQVQLQSFTEPLQGDQHVLAIADGDSHRHMSPQTIRAVEDALDQVRAAFGARAVCRGVLEDAYVPEDRFRWVPLTSGALSKLSVAGFCSDPFAKRATTKISAAKISASKTSAARDTPLVASTEQKPTAQMPVAQTLVPMLTRELLPDSLHIAIQPEQKPKKFYRIQYGWWRQLVDREYGYAQTRQQRILWLFYDRIKRAWFQHGFVD